MQYLGKSENGASLATIYDERLRVCNLVESDGQTDWVCKHDFDLDPLTSLEWHDLSGFKKTWTLDESDDDEEDYDDDDDNDDDDDDYDDDEGKEEVQEEKEEEKQGEKNEGTQMVENTEWNSDDENILNIEDDHEDILSWVSPLQRGNFLGVIIYRSGLSLEKLKDSVSSILATCARTTTMGLQMECSKPFPTPLA
jgi:hypothetical protein